MATTTTLSDNNDPFYMVEDPTGETVFALAGDDALAGGTGNDILDGGDGTDVVVYTFAQSFDGTGVTVDLSQSGFQDIGADQGSDQLIGFEDVVGSLYDDVLIGDADANALAGVDGDDILSGGGGDDNLLGGLGADSFHYAFTTEAAGQDDSFTGWLARNGFGDKVGSDGGLMDGATQDFFATKYTAYLQHLVQDFQIGKDSDGDGEVKVGIKQNDPSGLPFIEGLSATEVAAMFGSPESVLLQTGKTSHVRWYSDSFEIGGGSGQTVSEDGEDRVYGFSIAEGDRLDFDLEGAVNEAQFAELFDWTEKEVDDGLGTLVNSTVLSLAGDSSWSIALIGATGLTDAELYGAITFS
jgi:hypothetical protein